MASSKNFSSELGLPPSKSICLGLLLTIILAFAMRLLEWPCWQNPEYQYDGEMLLATHDAYHWVAGACGFGRAAGHPMSVILANLSTLTGVAPAQIAFWIPAVMASLFAGAVYLWCLILGGSQCGIAAGLIASLSPGFLGRTLLGFYDTDLVTLFFPLLISFAPALWIIKTYKNKRIWQIRKNFSSKDSGTTASRRMLIMLAISGLLAWWTQEWHSVFPYVIRFDIFFLFFWVILFSPRASNCHIAALCYALPALGGPWGLAYPLLAICSRSKALEKINLLLKNQWFMLILWCVVLYLWLQGEIYDTLMNQINAYLKHAGDEHISGSSSLVFPSVAQSIIEVQDLSYAALFSYFHPWLEAGLLGFAGYLFVIWKRPAAIFLLPLAALGILSSKLGGRMVMFGAPIMAIGISLGFYWLFERIFRRWLSAAVYGWLVCIFLSLVLVFPFLDLIPALSQGPVLNRRHAAALAQARVITPPDSTLWVWWDWGYAAHYFARRGTIADGALHGGPSLYLPAAVFATSNPRFARQIIRRTSQQNNEAGKFFENLDAAQAQALIDSLRSPDTPLVKGAGKQFIIVSFEMLKLGFWISNYGNWNFITRAGDGGALSIVPEGLSYRLKAGEVRLDGRPGIIFPTSINIFAETGVTVKNYAKEWFGSHPDATLAQQKAWLESRRNINFLFNQVTDEKLAVDQGLYESLMIQLLLCDANDPRYSPYFRLIYDNVFARVYEVLPLDEETS